MADIQVNLVDKKDRKSQSHDIVKQLRPAVQLIAQKYHANVKLVEIPPGPPVLSTLVAEIYGPDYQQQEQIATQVKSMFARTADVVDVDWYTEDNQQQYHFEIDKEKNIWAQMKKGPKIPAFWFLIGMGIPERIIFRSIYEPHRLIQNLNYDPMNISKKKRSFLDVETNKGVDSKKSTKKTSKI